MKRALAMVGALLVFTACSGGSKDLGTEATDPPPVVDTTTTVAQTTTTIEATTTTAPPAEMPDVLGKTATSAGEQLASLGVDDVRITEVEHISKPGTILEQVPSEGREITGPVDLTVAKPLAPMPDWTGKQVAEAKKYFDARGVTIVVEESLDDTLTEGSIISTTPAATQSISSEIKLVVAKTPVTLVLAELEPVEQDGNCGSGYRTGDIAVNGATQQRSVWFSTYQRKDQACSVDYNLGRDWSRLKASIGISDVSKSELQCRFEIFADNNPLFNQTVALGQLVPIDLDVTNVLRLRIIATPVTEVAGGDCVLASLRLIGSGTS